MAVEDVVVNSSVGIDGNSYTSSISNDTLTNEDFLTLMLEEMKMQDPTEPMDSDKILDDQLQMSQIQANDDMSKALNDLSAAYQSSALSSAVSFMDKTIEDGTVDPETGMLNSYKVATVESLDGEIYVNAYEQTGYYHKIRTTVEDDEGNSVYVDLAYDPDSGKIYDENGEDSGVNVLINPDGSFAIVDDQYQFVDNEGEPITDEDILSQYEISNVLPLYAEESTKINVNSITKVYGS